MVPKAKTKKTTGTRTTQLNAFSGGSRATPKDLVKPTAVAKEMDLAPQYIYNWIKNKRIFSDNSSGTMLVSRSEVEDRIRRLKDARASGIRLGRAGSGKKEVYILKPPFKPGAMFTYHPRLTRRKPVIALVIRTDRYFTYVKTNTIVTPRDLGRKTETMTESSWRNESLRSLIDKKAVAILNPWEVLQMIEEQFRLQGQPERADKLHDWILEEGRKRKREVAAAQAAKSRDTTTST